MSTLAEIRTKVRLLAKMPSELNMTNDEIDVYINTFYLDDLPQEVELFELRTNLEFCTTPYLDTYRSTAGDFNFNLKDFKDIIVSVDNPIYISGRRMYLTQSQIEFYNLYPKDKDMNNIGIGDGVETDFPLLISNSVLRRSVVIGSRDNAGKALIITDEPNTDASGREAATGILFDPAGIACGDINYVTGVINIEFNDAAPALDEPITYELEQFSTGSPDTILFFDNEFILRPTPDKVYEVQIEVEKRPYKLEDDADEPMVNQWSQAIAYGAAIKILQDYGDIETTQILLPEYDNQLTLITRRTSKIRAKETVSTTYNAKLLKGWRWNNG